jgi:hypothetical protein
MSGGEGVRVIRVIMVITVIAAGVVVIVGVRRPITMTLICLEWMCSLP